MSFTNSIISNIEIVVSRNDAPAEFERISASARAAEASIISANRAIALSNDAMAEGSSSFAARLHKLYSGVIDQTRQLRTEQDATARSMADGGGTSFWSRTIAEIKKAEDAVANASRDILSSVKTTGTEMDTSGEKATGFSHKIVASFGTIAGAADDTKTRIGGLGTTVSSEMGGVDRAVATGGSAFVSFQETVKKQLEEAEVHLRLKLAEMESLLTGFAAKSRGLNVMMPGVQGNRGVVDTTGMRDETTLLKSINAELKENALRSQNAGQASSALDSETARLRGKYIELGAVQDRELEKLFALDTAYKRLGITQGAVFSSGMLSNIQSHLGALQGVQSAIQQTAAVESTATSSMLTGLDRLKFGYVSVAAEAKASATSVAASWRTAALEQNAALALMHSRGAEAGILSPHATGAAKAVGAAGKAGSGLEELAAAGITASINKLLELTTNFNQAKAAMNDFTRVGIANFSELTTVEQQANAVLDKRKEKMIELAAAEKKYNEEQARYAKLSSKPVDINPFHAGKKGLASSALTGAASSLSNVQEQLAALDALDAKIKARGALDTDLYNKEHSGELATQAALAKTRGEYDKVIAREEEAGKKSKEAALEAAHGFSLVGIGIGAVSLAAAGWAVHTAMGFDEALTHVQAFGGASKKDIEQVRPALIAMSEQLGMSAQSLATGLYNIYSANVSGNAANIMLKASANAAAASQTDLATVTNATTTVYNAYHLKASQIKDTVDQMNLSVLKGKMEWSDFANSLGSTVPLAAQLGVKIGTLGSAYAILTNSGNSAQESGQMIANLLNSMSAPTDRQIKMAKALGFQWQDVFGKAAIQAKGLPAILETINQKIQQSAQHGPNDWQYYYQNMDISEAKAKKMAEQFGNANMIAKEFFGGNHVAMRTFFSLMSDGGAQFDTLNNSMKNSNSVQKSLAVESQDASYKFRQLLETCQALAIEVGTALLPGFERFMKIVEPAVKNMAEWAKANKDAVAEIIKWGTIIGVFSAVVFAAKFVAAPIMTLGKGIKGIFSGPSDSAKTIAAIKQLGTQMGYAKTEAGELNTKMRELLVSMQKLHAEGASAAAAEQRVGAAAQTAAGQVNDLNAAQSGNLGPNLGKNVAKTAEKDAAKVVAKDVAAQESGSLFSRVLAGLKPSAIFGSGGTVAGDATGVIAKDGIGSMLKSTALKAGLGTMVVGGAMDAMGGGLLGGAGLLGGEAMLGLPGIALAASAGLSMGLDHTDVGKKYQTHIAGDVPVLGDLFKSIDPVTIPINWGLTMAGMPTLDGRNLWKHTTSNPAADKSHADMQKAFKVEQKKENTYKASVNTQIGDAKQQLNLAQQLGDKAGVTFWTSVLASINKNKPKHLGVMHDKYMDDLRAIGIRDAKKDPAVKPMVDRQLHMADMAKKREDWLMTHIPGQESDPVFSKSKYGKNYIAKEKGELAYLQKHHIQKSDMDEFNQLSVNIAKTAARIGEARGTGFAPDKPKKHKEAPQFNPFEFLNLPKNVSKPGGKGFNALGGVLYNADNAISNAVYKSTSSTDAIGGFFHRVIEGIPGGVGNLTPAAIGVHLPSGADKPTVDHLNDSIKGLTKTVNHEGGIGTPGVGPSPRHPQHPPRTDTNLSPPEMLASALPNIKSVPDMISKSGAGKALADFANWKVTVPTPDLSGITGAFGAASKTIGGFLSEITSSVASFVASLASSIGSEADHLFHGLTDWAGKAKDFLASSIPSLVSGVLTWIKRLPGDISSAVAPILASLKGPFEKAKPAIESALSGIGSAVKSKITGFVSDIETLPGHIGSAVGTVVSKFGSLKDQVIAHLTTLSSQVASHVKTMVSGLVSNIEGLPGRAGSIFGSLVTVVTGHLSNLAQNALSQGKSIASSLVGAVEGLPGRLGPIFGTLATTVLSHLTALATGIAGWATTAAGNFTKWGTQFVTNMGAALGGAAGTIMGGITTAWAGATSWLTTTLPQSAVTWGKAMATSLASGISGAANEITKAVAGILPAAIKAAEDWLGKHKIKLNFDVGGMFGSLNPFHNGGGFGGGAGPGAAGLAGAFGAGGGTFVNSGVEKGNVDMYQGLHIPYSGSLQDWDYSTQAGGVPVHLPGGKDASYRFRQSYTLPGMGTADFFNTPGGGVVQTNHMQGGPNLKPGQVVHGGQYIGQSGEPTDPKYGEGWHLCIVTDANGRAYLSMVTDSQLDDAHSNGQSLQSMGGGVSQWSSQINAAAKKTGLPAALIGSIIASESGGNPRAVSSANAQGLMQLLPGTAHSVGVSNTFDPGQNIMGGSTYFKQLLQKAHGDPELALEMYNAGPNASKKTLDKSKGYADKILSRAGYGGGGFGGQGGMTPGKWVQTHHGQYYAPSRPTSYRDQQGSEAWIHAAPWATTHPGAYYSGSGSQFAAINAMAKKSPLAFSYGTGVTGFNNSYAAWKGYGSSIPDMKNMLTALPPEVQKQYTKSLNDLAAKWSNIGTTYQTNLATENTTHQKKMATLRQTYGQKLGDNADTAAFDSAKIWANYNIHRSGAHAREIMAIQQIGNRGVTATGKGGTVDWLQSHIDLVKREQAANLLNPSQAAKKIATLQAEAPMHEKVNHGKISVGSANAANKADALSLLEKRYNLSSDQAQRLLGVQFGNIAHTKYRHDLSAGRAYTKASDAENTRHAGVVTGLQKTAENSTEVLRAAIKSWIAGVKKAMDPAALLQSWQTHYTKDSQKQQDAATLAMWQHQLPALTNAEKKHNQLLRDNGASPSELLTPAKKFSEQLGVMADKAAADGEKLEQMSFSAARVDYVFAKAAGSISGMTSALQAMQQHHLTEATKDVVLHGQLTAAGMHQLALMNQTIAAQEKWAVVQEGINAEGALLRGDLAGLDTALQNLQKSAGQDAVSQYMSTGSIDPGTVSAYKQYTTILQQSAVVQSYVNAQLALAAGDLAGMNTGLQAMDSYINGQLVQGFLAGKNEIGQYTQSLRQLRDITDITKLSEDGVAAITATLTGTLGDMSSALGTLSSDIVNEWDKEVLRTGEVQNQYTSDLVAAADAAQKVTAAQNAQNIVVGMITKNGSLLASGLQGTFSQALDGVTFFGQMMGRDTSLVSGGIGNIIDLSNKSLTAAQNLGTLAEVISGFQQVMDTLRSNLLTGFARTGAMDPASLAAYKTSKDKLSTANADDIAGSLTLDRGTDITAYVNDLTSEQSFLKGKLAQTAAQYGEDSSQYKAMKAQYDALTSEIEGLTLWIDHLASGTAIAADKQSEVTWALSTYTSAGLDPGLAALAQFTGQIQTTGDATKTLHDTEVTAQQAVQALGTSAAMAATSIPAMLSDLGQIPAELRAALNSLNIVTMTATTVNINGKPVGGTKDTTGNGTTTTVPTVHAPGGANYGGRSDSGYPVPVPVVPAAAVAPTTSASPTTPVALTNSTNTLLQVGDEVGYAFWVNGQKVVVAQKKVGDQVSESILVNGKVVSTQIMKTGDQWSQTVNVAGKNVDVSLYNTGQQVSVGVHTAGTDAASSIVNAGQVSGDAITSSGPAVAAAITTSVGAATTALQNVGVTVGTSISDGGASAGSAIQAAFSFGIGLLTAWQTGATGSGLGGSMGQVGPNGMSVWHPGSALGAVASYATSTSATSPATTSGGISNLQALYAQGQSDAANKVPQKAVGAPNSPEETAYSEGYLGLPFNVSTASPATIIPTSAWSTVPYVAPTAPPPTGGPLITGPINYSPPPTTTTPVDTSNLNPAPNVSVPGGGGDAGSPAGSSAGSPTTSNAGSGNGISGDQLLQLQSYLRDASALLQTSNAMSGNGIGTSVGSLINSFTLLSPAAQNMLTAAQRGAETPQKLVGAADYWVRQAKAIADQNAQSLQTQAETGIATGLTTGLTDGLTAGLTPPVTTFSGAVTQFSQSIYGLSTTVQSLVAAGFDKATAGTIAAAGQNPMPSVAYTQIPTTSKVVNGMTESFDQYGQPIVPGATSSADSAAWYPNWSSTINGLQKAQNDNYSEAVGGAPFDPATGMYTGTNLTPGQSNWNSYVTNGGLAKGGTTWTSPGTYTVASDTVNTPNGVLNPKASSYIAANGVFGAYDSGWSKYTAGAPSASVAPSGMSYATGAIPTGLAANPATGMVGTGAWVSFIKPPGFIPMSYDQFLSTGYDAHGYGYTAQYGGGAMPNGPITPLWWKPSMGPLNAAGTALAQTSTPATSLASSVPTTTSGGSNYVPSQSYSGGYTGTFQNTINPIPASGSFTNTINPIFASGSSTDWLTQLETSLARGGSSPSTNQDITNLLREINTSVSTTATATTATATNTDKMLDNDTQLEVVKWLRQLYNQNTVELRTRSVVGGTDFSDWYSGLGVTGVGMFVQA